MPKKLDRETIGQTPWGGAFLREVELVVARSKFSILVRDETKGIRTTGETMLELERRIQERVTELAPETMTP